MAVPVPRRTEVEEHCRQPPRSSVEEVTVLYIPKSSIKTRCYKATIKPSSWSLIR